MASFLIKFSNENKIYKAGDIVMCQITVNVREKFKARSLSIRFLGKAHTQWLESRTTTVNGKSKTVTETFTGNEEFFRNYNYLIGKNSGEQEISTGTYTYAMSYQLPQQLPSSFEHKYGHIRYTVKIKYDVPWGSDKTHTESFHVNANINLSHFPNLSMPVNETTSKSFGCCCWESEPMHLVNILPRNGWYPGEHIPATVEVNNTSNVKMTSIRLALKEKMGLVCTSPRRSMKIYSDILCEKYFPATVAAYQKRPFENTIFLNPNHDWKYFDGSSLFHVNYYIKSSVKTTGCHSNPERTTKITMGTTPVLDGPSVQPNFYPSEAESNAVVEQPLPSYSDATKVPTSNASVTVGWAVTDSEVHNVPAPSAPGKDNLGYESNEKREKPKNESEEPPNPSAPPML